ncbi:hypothetical protein [Vibrio alginolyticus]
MSINKFVFHILAACLISGCSTTDAFMTGYADSILGKSYVNTPEQASLVGQYAKNLEYCKTELSPQNYGKYVVDLNWLISQVDTESEQSAYSEAFNNISTLPYQSCEEFKYTAEVLHQQRLEEKRKLGY